MALDLETRVDFEYCVQTRFTTTTTWFYQVELACISSSSVSEKFFEGTQYFPL